MAVLAVAALPVVLYTVDNPAPRLVLQRFECPTFSLDLMGGAEASRSAANGGSGFVSTRFSFGIGHVATDFQFDGASNSGVSAFAAHMLFRVTPHEHVDGGLAVGYRRSFLDDRVQDGLEIGLPHRYALWRDGLKTFALELRPMLLLGSSVEPSLEAAFLIPVAQIFHLRLGGRVYTFQGDLMWGLARRNQSDSLRGSGLSDPSAALVDGLGVPEGFDVGLQLEHAANILLVRKKGQRAPHRPLRLQGFRQGRANTGRESAIARLLVVHPSVENSVRSPGLGLSGRYLPRMECNLCMSMGRMVVSSSVSIRRRSFDLPTSRAMAITCSRSKILTGSPDQIDFDGFLDRLVDESVADQELDRKALNDDQSAACPSAGRYPSTFRCS